MDLTVLPYSHYFRTMDSVKWLCSDSDPLNISNTKLFHSFHCYLFVCFLRQVWWCYNKRLKHRVLFCHTCELWARCFDRVVSKKALPRYLFFTMLQVLLYTTVWQAALKKRKKKFCGKDFFSLSRHLQERGYIYYMHANKMNSLAATVLMIFCSSVYIPFLKISNC